MDDIIAELSADVAAEEGVESSAEKLLAGIGLQIDAAVAAALGGDVTRLQALSASIKTNTAALAASVAAVPVAPTPAVEPAPEPVPVEPTPQPETPPSEPTE